MPPAGACPLKIDVHHHIFAPFLMSSKLKANNEVGWKTPPENLPWSLEKSMSAMDHLGIGAAVLSYPPGIAEKKRKDEVRKMNEYAQELCSSEASQGRFGWFACAPDLRDTEDALCEIQHALDELGADGVCFPSSYGEGQDAVYLGDEKFQNIWAELDKRATTVFVHGAQTPSSTPYPHEFLGLPITEVPNETFKAAAHLVVTGTKRRWPNVKMILAHFGGTTAMLIPRVAALSRYMGCELSVTEISEDFRSFYFDSALTSHESTLRFIESLMGRGKILFGTDYPAAGIQEIRWFTENLEDYYREDEFALAEVTRKTAQALFPRFLDL